MPSDFIHLNTDVELFTLPTTAIKAGSTKRIYVTVATQDPQTVSVLEAANSRGLGLASLTTLGLSSFR